ncbi:putative major facilitator superfamily protein [Lyophyllum shimeji]|uniref:Major facilitator superfamily protein n=1 Tax=Lyophyllum shimeji TaxID=47721 RepID=A0A9P3PZK9_LYOSH|nr:putative major facilitator superfamily protein [Lyophyllum shimeji]
MDLSDLEAEPRHAVETPPKLKKPFPIVQLSIVWLIQFTEPVSNTVIYPFINQFVGETGITRGDETKTGYYAGIVESAFFFAECLSVYHWGRLSDKIGRRPMSSRRVQWQHRCRLIEIIDPADVPAAFGWYPAVWSLGITLGPVIGGGLARPAIRWPKTFGRLQFFHKFPYFPPCAAAGAIAFSAYLYAYLLLQESLPSAVQRNIERKRADSPAPTTGEGVSAPLMDNVEQDLGYGSTGSYAPAPTDGFKADIADLEPPPLRVLLTRELVIAIICHGFIAFLDQSHGVMLPLMLSTSIPLGGLGFDPYTIGMTMGTWGLLNAGFQVVAFPRMMRRFGPHKLCVACFSCSVMTFSAFPMMSMLAKQTGEADYRVWLVLVLQLSCYSFVFMTYGCTQLFVLDAAPGRAAFGAINGLAQMTSSIVRTLAPTIATSLFSVSLAKQLAGGYMTLVHRPGTLTSTKSHIRTTSEHFCVILPEHGLNKGFHWCKVIEVVQVVVISDLCGFMPLLFGREVEPKIGPEDFVCSPLMNPSTSMNDDGRIVNEESALLSQSPKRRKPNPLPWFQISVVLLLQVCEPITSQSIYPYVNQLVSELDITGGDERRVGYYAGVIESLFFVTEAATVLQWSRLSDHVGRKPILLLGLFGTAASMLSFGLSRTFWGLVISRCLCGLLNGNIGVMKSVMGELTDATNRAEGFSLMPVYPRLKPFLERVPLLPSLPRDVEFRLRGICDYPYILRGDGSKKTETHKISLLTYPVIISVSNYVSLAFLNISLNALLPLFMAMPLEIGGLAFKPATIGYIMGSYGALCGLFQASSFARIIRWLGERRVFILGISTGLPIFALFPIMSISAKSYGVNAFTWTCIAVLLILMVFMDMSFGCIFIRPCRLREP